MFDLFGDIYEVSKKILISDSVNEANIMEPDSTTYDINPKTLPDGSSLPFFTRPGNYKLYEEFMTTNREQRIERHVIERLQSFGLLPNNVKCLNNTPECKVICRPARVVDRLQWACETCGKRQPIREGSFFLRMQCSLPQALQIVLAWCEDADLNVASEYFGVKTKVASLIYDRLDELAAKAYNKTLLGGPNSVVLAEMYPDCLNRLSPDTTDHPHVHRILMLADTKHIPTYYHLHVIKDDPRKTNVLTSNKNLKAQIESVVAKAIAPDSTLVVGGTVPVTDGAVLVQQLTQKCDADMQHFLTSRIWKQAITLCTASRDICTSAPLPAVCASAVQRYLDASLYRLRFGDGFYQHILAAIAAEYTAKSS